MRKRNHDALGHGELLERPIKRHRPLKEDRLSQLSDELILRTLSFLTLSDLVLCERLSRRLKVLAADGQIWKALYYDRFVRPRASRIPGIRMNGEFGSALHYSSRVSRWLDDEVLIRNGSMTNWKKQYKLRHNWSRGSARVKETEVAERPSTPPLLVRLQDDVIVIVDQQHGLRAWSLRKEHRLIGSQVFINTDKDASAAAPTSLAIDTNTINDLYMNVAVGFANGKFSIYTLFKHKAIFTHRYTHPASTAGEVSGLAYASPFLLTVNPEPRLSLYNLSSPISNYEALEPPHLLTSMRSQTVYAPLSLTLRSSASIIVASIAFAMQSYIPKWTVGIQELRLSSSGSVLSSRVAYAAKPLSRPLNSAHEEMLNILPLPSSRPASLSYNHPYLLTAHPDNTLTLYMVTSTEAGLYVSAGTVLWGHTSSISSAHVGDRGKAVSVSTRGNELRVWELEGRGGAAGRGRRVPGAEQRSVRVISEVNDRGPGSTQGNVQRQLSEYVDGQGKAREVKARSKISAARHGEHDVNETTKGWVAFDEEKVVLLREKMSGKQAVVVYDFT